MRKFSMGLILALAIVGFAAAQSQPQTMQNGQGVQQGQPQGQPQMAAPQQKSIEGKLAFVDTRPVVQAKDKTYRIEMINFFYYAYIDGIKAGDQVKLDGYEIPAAPGQDMSAFIVVRAVINGKTYDFTGSFGPMMRGRGGMMGNGRGMMGPDMMSPGNWGEYGRGGRR
jgi:hypothetical protein